ncbi:MAG TPA: hypothetical protein VGM67_12135 [Gemmatimonadaceae bacterium]|jgi:hypothetical protein
MANPLGSLVLQQVMKRVSQKVEPYLGFLLKMRLPEITVTKINTKILRQEIVDKEEVFDTNSMKSTVRYVRRPMQIVYTRSLQRVIKERLHGVTVVSPTVFKVLVSYDMVQAPTEPCPNLSAPRLDSIVAWAKSVGLQNPGSIFTGVALPHYYGQHAYVVAGHLGTVSDIMANTGLSREVVLTGMRDPLVYLMLWTPSVISGGVQLEWSNVRRLLEGGYARAQVTIGRDPIRLTGATQQIRDMFGDSLLSINALTEYGHALTGTAQHNLLILDGEHIVYVVIGAGGHWSSTPGDANIAVACWNKHGMWPGTIRNMRRALADGTVMRAVIDGAQTGDREELTRLIATTRNPDSLYALIRALSGHIVRGPSNIIGTLLRQSGQVKDNWTKD